MKYISCCIGNIGIIRCCIISGRGNNHYNSILNDNFNIDSIDDKDNDIDNKVIMKALLFILILPFK